jgi:hypothetical protein
VVGWAFYQKYTMEVEASPLAFMTGPVQKLCYENGAVRNSSFTKWVVKAVRDLTWWVDV